MTTTRIYSRQHALITKQLDRITELAADHYLGSTHPTPPTFENVAELSRISNDLQHIIDYSSNLDPLLDEWLAIQDTYDAILAETGRV